MFSCPSFLIVCFLITLFLTSSIFKASYTAQNGMEKKTSFECGFNNITKNKSSFSTKFFLVMILFLVFDLEIAILLPSVLIQDNSNFTLLLPLIFITIVTLAMLIEWFNGILEWSS